MKKWLKILAVLFVLVVFWLFYFVLQFTYGTPENNNLNYIPENSSLVIAFNGNLALKTVLSDFLSSQDEALLNKMNDSRDEYDQNTGIDVLSDIILVKFNNGNLEITGLIFNLRNEHDFKSNFEGKIIASNSSVGLLLLNETEDDIAKLRQVATSVLKKNNLLYKNKLASTRKNKSLVTIWTRAEPLKSWSCANLSLNGSTVLIDGTAMFNKSHHNDLPQLKPNNSSFHASIKGLVPDIISDSIVKFLQIEDNKILGFSTNYRSLKIEQEKSFEIVPNGDFVFNFSKPIDINSLLKSAHENEIIINLTTSQYNYGGQIFYYNQPSDNSFYIGRTPYQNIQLENNSAVITVHGSPSYLSKIEGSPLMIRLLNIFPAYRMGNGLSQSIESIDIEVNSGSNKTVSIKGEIQFKQGNYASIELIRNLLELR